MRHYHSDFEDGMYADGYQLKTPMRKRMASYKRRHSRKRGGVLLGAYSHHQSMLPYSRMHNSSRGGVLLGCAYNRKRRGAGIVSPWIKTC